MNTTLTVQIEEMSNWKHERQVHFSPQAIKEIESLPFGYAVFSSYTPRKIKGKWISVHSSPRQDDAPIAFQEIVKQINADEDFKAGFILQEELDK
jgi:hypothetical protein